MPHWYDKRVVVLGCGNVLFGDDGFGPAVAQHCQEHYRIPADICVLDAGTS
ncbi:MAG: hydrogenase maturation protease, partial [Gemmatimonadales bacterium]|nr:hydrogenase maturation protease [Gemmatimonadales bacterium]